MTLFNGTIIITTPEVEWASKNPDNPLARYLISIFQNGGTYGQDDRYTYWADDTDFWNEKD